ncbi:hypothetical protein HY490_00120 [Candidatus Woesearchaeota archaeon]|nr:hypothetical protein [Candidatus Woesearchaeota archaeon]
MTKTTLVGAAAKFCGILTRTEAQQLRARIRKHRAEIEEEFTRKPLTAFAGLLSQEEAELIEKAMNNSDRYFDV